MKKLISFISAASLFGILFFTSCSKQEDPAPTTSSPTFVGNWRISENSKDYGPSTYNVTIADSSNASYIQIAYLYNLNKKTYATVSGNNFTIPKQLIQGNYVSGTGVLTNANRIDMKYLVQTTGTHYDTLTAGLTK